MANDELAVDSSLALPRSVIGVERVATRRLAGTSCIVNKQDALTNSGGLVKAHAITSIPTVLFDRALDLAWARLGIYSGQILARGHSSFALQSHLHYKRELRLGDALDFDILLLDYDAKRVHYLMRMLHRQERWVAATCEQLSICMDMNTRRSTAWPAEALVGVAALHAAHQDRPRPAEVGQAIGIRRRAAT